MNVAASNHTPEFGLLIPQVTAPGGNSGIFDNYEGRRTLGALRHISVFHAFGQCGVNRAEGCSRDVIAVAHDLDSELAVFTYYLSRIVPYPLYAESRPHVVTNTNATVAAHCLSECQVMSGDDVGLQREALTAPRYRCVS